MLRARRHITRLFLAVILVVTVALDAPVAAQNAASAQVLSASDIQLYRQIFNLQQRRAWLKADRLIRQLDDRLLVGHVLEQRYMHPTGWRSTYEQLHNWMKAYADHPEAERVYKLASKRRPRSGWKPLQRPRIAQLSYPADLLSGVATRPLEKPPRSRRSSHDRRILRQVYRNVYRDRMTVTEKMLRTRDGHGMSSAGMSEARAALARGHLSNHRFDRAIKQGDMAATGADGGKRLGAFYAGLAFWAQGNRAEALQRFRTAAATPADQVGSLKGAIAFWRARAALSEGHFSEANDALVDAAQNGRSLYGMIARAQLARRGGFSWQKPGLSTEALIALQTNAPVRRAMALTEVGEVARADAELKRLSRRVDRKGAGVLVILSEVIDAPATAYRLARIRLKSHGEQHDTALFPMPSWQIDETVPVDRALLMAVARRESGFNAVARSRVGARGLMQLMPGTARYIAKIKGYRQPGRAGLNDPETSLKFGQAYLAYLANLVKPKGCLIHILAAYNAGPGNVQKWQRRFGDRKDPLLFLELMGSRETRHFIKDVLPAYWIYRGRMQMPAPSLDALAEGRWPVYVPATRLAELGSATGEMTDAHR